MTNSSPRQASSLNTNMLLRAKLINEGFSAEIVDNAIGDMWDRHMAYDDFDSVLLYLRRKSPTKEERHEEENTAESSAGLTSAGTMLTFDTEEVSVGVATKGSCLLDESQHDSTSSIAPSHENRRFKTAPRPLGLAAKLDLVADYENFTDAVFALTEWANKAAKQAELEELCEAKETQALPTVVRRAILEDASPAKFEQSVMPSVLHLIGSILLHMGFTSCSVTSIRKTLEIVMKQARKATLKVEDEDKRHALADNAARNIVSRVSIAIQEFRSATEANAGQMISRLEKEIESTVSALATTSEGGVVELMMKRDMQKEVAEKSSVVVGVSISSSSDDDSEEPKEEAESKEEAEHARLTKEDVLQSLVGKDDLETLEASRSEHQALKTELSNVQSEIATTSEELQTELDSYNEERKLIVARIEELRRTIEQLEKNDVHLCQKIAAAEKEAKEANEVRSGKVEELERKLKDTAGPFEFANAVHKLATGLKSYDESLHKGVSISSSPDSEVLPDPAEGIPRRMGVYLVHARNYFRSEAKCVLFLRRRLDSLEQEARNLEHELEECNSLGMKANAAQVSTALSRARDNIQDDKSAINGLCGEAQIMYEDLLARVELYTSSNDSDKPSLELSPLHLSVLRGIVKSLSEIGLDDNARLQAFLTPCKGEEEPSATVASESKETKSNGGEASGEETAPPEPPIAAPQSAAVPATQQASPKQDELKAKLTWAKPGAQAKKKAAKTLTEIQEEELSSSKKD